MATEEEQVQSYFDAALKLVELAGKQVLEAITDRDKKVSEKRSATDLVTETDGLIEKLLFDGLRRQFPDHKFIGEETTSLESLTGDVGEMTNAPTWIIDPIDGTMNFVHSNPMVSISVGLVVNRRIVIGIVYAPVIGAMYTAIKGKGTKLNGKPVKVSDCKSLNKALFIMEVWAQDGPESEQIQVENFATVMPKVHSLRCIGSAAINLAFVSAGQADLYQQSGIHCWDIVAGALLVSEAGGVVLDPSGGPFDYMSRAIMVSSTPQLAEALVALNLKHVSTFKRDHRDCCPM